ncbi:putative hydrolase of the HAD superfamily [Clostridium saccharoperbutylacetonicum]|uniref:Haloacid dehalogenase superfamily, subfamily IA, variant 1 with third motif having Dx(3-4)D or Dx(3-4)E n=1 Tax=Clostridium saccharoperbutylacetonicum N1-4(HMT) TaxID=931276 RepID=M1LYG2_9CLOT|nr:HAD-IA family hydrolase [Clostridium saccharoperbutylacetonicum]AGF58290.1 haloacid dehalogenase superfamily, subfamily IA, variant 1 with third motif having Dx(3-4)D or Dx(3-4)E [Clostridium saccharoperbutylacetonicum N1-4(HMT)]NRT60933.1 putative hydrolase of the HAD superfamily [Clostridium saccharoperbutylacetonicum]NSB24246.1 putative hydrolase of the HAD superfamily [Clostridium saccharoperbutylacetonicum]NSB43624.1 putative hydrolase of the HAD superfamily [Clostridium saccharoperbuty
MIKVLIFDLDDTLYYEKNYVLGGFREVATYLSSKYNISIELLYDRCLQILEKDGRGKIFDIICEENKFDEDVNKLVSIYRDAKPKLALYKDSIEILNWIKGNKLKSGIITDGYNKVQWEKIKSLGLEKIIDKIIVTDDYGEGFGKPNKRSYIDMIKFFNVNPKECVYIGDNPTKDFIGAKEIGINTVRIIREYGDHINAKLDSKYEAEFTIYNLNEIKEIIFND